MVRLLKDELDRKGIRSKQRIYRNGSQSGGQGAVFAKRALYALLSNPIYVGEIAHKGARYPGQHQAILDRETWDSAQDQRRNAGPEATRTDRGNAQPAGRQGLRWRLTTGNSRPLHANKAGRRYPVLCVLPAGHGHSRADTRWLAHSGAATRNSDRCRDSGDACRAGPDSGGA